MVVHNIVVVGVTIALYRLVYIVAIVYIVVVGVTIALYRLRNVHRLVFIFLRHVSPY